MLSVLSSALSLGGFQGPLRVFRFFALGATSRSLCSTERLSSASQGELTTARWHLLLSSMSFCLPVRVLAGGGVDQDQLYRLSRLVQLNPWHCFLRGSYQPPLIWTLWVSVMAPPPQPSHLVSLSPLKAAVLLHLSRMLKEPVQSFPALHHKHAWDTKASLMEAELGR